MIRDAHFSDCKSYRYALWRIWGEAKPLVMFVGLNPSKAGKEKDDPTIRRLYGFADSWGFGGFYVTNLFAFVATDPRQLITTEPENENDKWLKLVSASCERVVFAWGNCGFKERELNVQRMFPNAYAIALNKNGTPKHPLYIRAGTQPVKFPSLASKYVIQ